MGNDEPLTNREITAKFAEIDKKFDQERDDRGKIDDRITKLAGDSVTAEAWGRENGHIYKGIAEVDAHCEERHRIVMKALGELKDASESALRDVKTSIEKRSDLTWQRILGIVSILAVLAAAWYTALHQGGH